MNYLIPGFLKRLDHYLLTNYPVVWRTRAHYFLFYGLLLGNFLAIAIPYLTITVLDTFPILEVVKFLPFIFLGLGGILFFWYGNDQYQHPLKSIKYEDYLITIALYTLCVVSIGSVLLTSIHNTYINMAKKDAPKKASENYYFLIADGKLTLDKKEELRHFIDTSITAQNLMDFYQCSHLKSGKEISDSDLTLLHKRAYVFKEAQLYHYEKGKVYHRAKFTNVYASFVENYNKLTHYLLIVFLVIPTVLMIWSKIGFNAAVIVTAAQVLLGIVIVGCAKAFYQPFLFLLLPISQLIMLFFPKKVSKNIVRLRWGSIYFVLLLILVVLEYYVLLGHFAAPSPNLIVESILFVAINIIAISVLSRFIAEKNELVV